MRAHDLLIVSGLLLVLAGTCEATTYVVNPEGTGDFPMIQDAISAAVDGDVIQLTDGTFSFPPNVFLRFFGKEITLESQSGNAEACVLDGLGSSLGSAMMFSDGEGPQCVVRGITMRRFGTGVFTGGGFLINDGSSPTIEKCRVLECYQEMGGAIVIDGPSSPKFSDCVFQGNRADGPGGGGLIAGTGSVTFERCLIAGNRSGVFGSGWYGGGIAVASDATVTMIDCTIAGTGRVARAILHSEAGSLSSGKLR